jgi:hypothetical protein
LKQYNEIPVIRIFERSDKVLLFLRRVMRKFG